jgi:enamine deaminase RidA (YjgF/YER057c/UK114 family)
MAITYIWEITSLKTKNETLGDGVVLPNAVCQTYWKKIGTDENGNQGTFSGATPFSAANLTEESFKQFDTLTEEIVLGWIQAIVVDGYEEHVNGQIQKQIDEKVTPITESAMPWAAVVEAEEVVE